MSSPLNPKVLMQMEAMLCGQSVYRYVTCSVVTSIAFLAQTQRQTHR